MNLELNINAEIILHLRNSHCGTCGREITEFIPKRIRIDNYISITYHQCLSCNLNEKKPNEPIL